ncbi:hypothetical protein LA080_011754, partial [Diaporthe eres]
MPDGSHNIVSAKFPRSGVTVSCSVSSFQNPIDAFIMQLTAILALATTAACSALPAQIPAGVEYTQVSAAHISESISMAAPAFNETAVILIESRDRELSKRANHGVYLCVDTGFSGYCVHIVAPAGVC